MIPQNQHQYEVQTDGGLLIDRGERVRSHHQRAKSALFRRQFSKHGWIRSVPSFLIVGNRGRGLKNGEGV